MAATREKAAYANVIGTQKGYRATVKTASGKVLASCHFNVKHTLTNYGAECDRAYAEMKAWLAGFGVS